MIDWGCVRVEPETLKDYCQQLEKAFPDNPSLSSPPNPKKVTSKEKKHDPFTGMPHFLSIRVLLWHTLQSVIDDIKSLLYVLIYFVTKNIKTFQNAPLCRKGLTEEELALKKTLAFTCLKYFHKWAGLNDLNLSQHDQECFKLLKTFIKCLFFNKESATSMLSSLLTNKKDPQVLYNSVHWLISCPKQVTSPELSGAPNNN
ncbi:hypothetical protein EV182_000339 [Spiromyces aspiralis]|uniref:Uncharacterized protein n=1 Tax=Spiromyces aspiralis TaxID=68401 RepID=A0ACC1HIP4_9FUNG|nr:hypothetical protein EV182_000339 [Spiromyces aspiralis]